MWVSFGENLSWLLDKVEPTLLLSLSIKTFLLTLLIFSQVRIGLRGEVRELHAHALPRYALSNGVLVGDLTHWCMHEVVVVDWNFLLGAICNLHQSFHWLEFVSIHCWLKLHDSIDKNTGTIMNRMFLSMLIRDFVAVYRESCSCSRLVLDSPEAHDIISWYGASNVILLGLCKLYRIVCLPIADTRTP